MLNSRFVLCAVLGLSSSVLPGCLVDAGESLFILKNQAADVGCSLGTDKGGEFISRGVLDVNSRSEYTFTPLVESRAAAANPNDTLQRTILIEGAEISLEFETGVSVDASDANFTQRFSGAIEPGALAVFIFDIIPRGAGLALENQVAAGSTTQVLAAVTMFGELGNGDVESPEFIYPVQVCNGCRGGVGGDPVAYPSCVDFTPGALSCLPGQDGFFIDCCVPLAGGLACPPVPEVLPP